MCIVTTHNISISSRLVSRNNKMGDQLVQNVPTSSARHLCWPPKPTEAAKILTAFNFSPNREEKEGDDKSRISLFEGYMIERPRQQQQQQQQRRQKSRRNSSHSSKITNLQLMFVWSLFPLSLFLPLQYVQFVLLILFWRRWLLKPKQQLRSS